MLSGPEDRSWRDGAPVRRHAFWIGALLLAQLILTLAVRPRGEFPLNDDWAYAHSVIWLGSEGRVRLSDWIAMNLLPQTLAGAAFTQLLGFSFTKLRLLTQIVALMTSVAAYVFLLGCGLTRVRAFVACLILVCLPWWQVLANSFMTDIHGLVLALLAAAAFVRHLEQPRPILLLAGTALAVVGVLQRQVVAVVPLAFAAAWLLTADFGWRQRLATALLPLTLVALAEITYQAYLVSGPGLPSAQATLHGRLPRMALSLASLHPDYWRWFLGNLAQFWSYLGLAVAPWTLMLLWRRPHRWLLPLLAAGIAAGCFALDWHPPHRENHVLDAAGIGPFTLHDGLSPDPAIPRPHGLAWTLASIAAAGGMAAIALGLLAIPARWAEADRRQRGRLIFLGVLLAAYLLPFAITDYIDRYLFFIVPFVIAWLDLALQHDDTPPPRLLIQATVVIVLAGGLASAAAAHDYFAWNRARWQAIDDARTHYAATPADLDGGFEYNGWHNFERRKDLPAAAGKSRWWIADDRLVVSFAPRTGYRVLRTYPVRRWLRRTPAQIYLSERLPKAGG